MRILCRLFTVIAVVAMVTLICLGNIEASTDNPALHPVEHVELSRYAGLWYEIAHYANKIEENCQDSTVAFSIRTDGDIDILTSCRDKQNGALHHANGRGWVIDAANNARLKFSFFWPFRTEYLIIDQGKEYDYAVICTPDKKRIWIIARTQQISSELFESIVQRIEKQGFNRNGIILTQHSNT
jgi:apolipoprotein D and lipocalin family protein